MCTCSMCTLLCTHHSRSDLLLVPPQVQQVLREVEEDYRREVIARLAAMGRQVPKGVDPLDIVLEPEGSRWVEGRCDH